MKKKFVINLAILLFLNLLVKLFWIFKIDRTVQITVGASVYGTYFSLLSLSVIFNIFLDAGLNNFNNRALAQDPKLFRDQFPGILALKVMLTVLYAIICLGTGMVLHYDHQQFHLLWMLVINQALASFILFFRSNISGLQMFITDSLLSVTDRFIMIIICAVLLWSGSPSGPFRIEWFVYAQTASYVMALLVAVFVLSARVGLPRFRLHRRALISVLGKSLPFALLILLMGFYNRIDSVMIERMLPVNGKEQAGIYAQAFRLLDAFSMFGVLFAGLLLPMFARMLARKENATELLRLSLLLILIPSLLISIGSWAYGKEIMGMLYPQHVEQSTVILQYLMTGFLGISVTYIFGTLLTANGSLRALNLMASFTLLLNVALNLLLIPRLQATGSAIASMSTQLFAALLQIFISFRLLRLKMGYMLPGKLCLFVILLAALAFLSTRLTIHWPVNLLAFLLGGFILAEILQLFSIPGLFRLIREDTGTRIT